MNILIIGATGFIGSALCKQLQDDGITVYGCGRKKKEEIQHSLLFMNDYWSMQDGDVPNTFWCNANMVILLAAKRPYTGFNMADYHANVALVSKYLDESVSHGVDRFILTSSKSVYSGKGMPWRESQYCAPSSLYGASKQAGEQLGMYYNLTGKIEFVSLRLAQVIGVGEKQRNLIKVLMNNAANKNPQTIYGNGQQKRQYVYIRDVCRAFIEVIRCPRVDGLFNIGMPRSYTNLEVAETVNDVFQNTGNIILRTDIPERGNSDEMNIKKAEEKLGFKAIWDLRSSINDMKDSLDA